MNHEPLWRKILNWGTVITFFSAPLLIFGLQILSEENWAPWFHFAKHLGEFKWLGNFYNSITALTFGLAGLNSWDRRGMPPQTPRSFPPPQIPPPIPKQPSKRSD
jgi:hypothetical protein